MTRALLSRPVLWVLLVLNLPVLLGQLWPEGAPPFAVHVNVAFLVLTLAVTVARLIDGRKPEAA